MPMTAPMAIRLKRRVFPMFSVRVESLGRTVGVIGWVHLSKEKRSGGFLHPPAPLIKEIT